jgi:hypothetical protein
MKDDDMEVDGEGGEGDAGVIGATMVLMLNSGDVTSVPPSQLVGVRPLREAGTKVLGLPPHLFLHVAVAMCPSARLLHVALVCAVLDVLPCVQQ